MSAAVRRVAPGCRRFPRCGVELACVAGADAGPVSADPGSHGPRRTAGRRHQQTVARRALERSLWPSIGSLLLGVGLLAARLAAGERASAQRAGRGGARGRASQRAADPRAGGAFERRRHGAGTAICACAGRPLGARLARHRARFADRGSDQLGRASGRPSRCSRASCGPWLRRRRRRRRCASRLRHADGRWLHVEIVAENRFADPAVGGLVLNMRDVSERIAFEDELRHQASTTRSPALPTGRCSRTARHALAAAAADARGRWRCCSSTSTTSRRSTTASATAPAMSCCRASPRGSTRSCARPTRRRDSAATSSRSCSRRRQRTGGAGDRRADPRGARASAFVVDGARAEGDGVDRGRASATARSQADELLRNADMAMYAAKASGKNSVQAFEQTMHRSALERLELRSELQRALERDEFELDYQPIVSLETGAHRRRRGAGALAAPDPRTPGPGPVHRAGRGDRADRPARTLGARARLRAGCASGSSPRPDAPTLYVSVNVSIRQLQRGRLPRPRRGDPRAHRARPHSLVLEITESAARRRSRSDRPPLQALKQLGVRLASTTSAPATRRSHTCSSSRSTSSRSTSRSSTSSTRRPEGEPRAGDHQPRREPRSSTSSPRESSSANRPTGSERSARPRPGFLFSPPTDPPHSISSSISKQHPEPAEAAPDPHVDQRAPPRRSLRIRLCGDWNPRTRRSSDAR